MSYTTGENLKITLFGQSHSDAIGVIIDGLPAGFEIDIKRLEEFMERRAPGRNKYQTPRHEADKPEFLSGLIDGNITCGAPLCAIIKNTNTRSKDYKNLSDIPRPGHSDYTAYVKYGGFNDIRGGGQFSGRMTAPLCIAGGILIQLLEKMGIKINARIKSIKGINDIPVDYANPDVNALSKIKNKELAVIDDEAFELMKKEIENAKKNGDSVGGIIECFITGVPEGIGGPLFEGLEGKISQAVFAVPAVKGIEFGSGFDSADMFGSEHNDPYYIDSEGHIRTKTNNSGGILGGITSGMPVVFKLAIKPTPSIAKEQDSISIEERKNKKLSIEGRHDPCILPRAVPVIEAVSAIVLADLIKGDLII